MRTAAGELLLFADDLAICKLKMSDLLTYFASAFVVMVFSQLITLTSALPSHCQNLSMMWS